MSEEAGGPGQEPRLRPVTALLYTARASSPQMCIIKMARCCAEDPFKGGCKGPAGQQEIRKFKR